jgi:hypothetical protein
MMTLRSTGLWGALPLHAKWGVVRPPKLWHCVMREVAATPWQQPPDKSYVAASTYVQTKQPLRLLYLRAREHMESLDFDRFIGSGSSSYIGVRAPRDLINKTIFNNNTQNIRLIPYLCSASGKGFYIFFFSSPTTRSKREPFLQMSLQEIGYSDLGRASPST